MDDVFDCRGNGVASGEWGVYDDAQVFHLEIGLVQGLKWTSIIEIVIERYSEVGVRDGGDEGGMFGRRWERVEVVAMNWDIDGEDRGDF